MNLKNIFVIIFISAINQLVFAQNDRAQYVDYTNHFYNTVKESFGEEVSEARKVFKMDPTGHDFPKSVKEFTTVWCNDPLSQGRTGTCWDFATSSFYEAEIFKSTENSIKLSEMYITYWEYVSKAEEYVATDGKSFLGEGSETNAVKRQMKKHGLMPQSVFLGKSAKNYDHKMLFTEFKSTLLSYSEKDDLDNPELITDVKKVLDKYIGTPPANVLLNEKLFTPQEFMSDVCKLEPDNYIDFMSLKEKPYWTQAEYTVPDNYWHSKDYFNVPLDNFMSILKTAIKKGYSISIGGDVSGPGYLPELDVAVIPDFDLPSKYINEDSRQLRFNNGATTDDHAIHVVGYKVDQNGVFWFLVKDSGSSSRNGNNEGYFFFHEDYVKLKVMTFTINKNAVDPALLARFVVG